MQFALRLLDWRERLGQGSRFLRVVEVETRDRIVGYLKRWRANTVL